MSSRLFRKVLNAILVATSLFGYLEWGTNNSSFLLQAELEVIRRFLVDPLAVSHPFTVLPMLGQALLLATLFQTEPSKLFTCIGIACLGLLLMFIAFIGVMSMNAKIFFSTLPFLITAIIAIIQLRKK